MADGGSDGACMTGGLQEERKRRYILQGQAEKHAKKAKQQH